MKDIPPDKKFLVLILGLIVIIGILLSHLLFESPSESRTAPLINTEITEMALIGQNSLIAISPVSFPRKQVLGVVTAYNNLEWQTDDSPNIMASGKRVFEGAIACPEWLDFGTQVRVKEKIFVCEDRMAKRFRQGNYFDIFMFSLQEAKEFGRQKMEITIY